MDNWETAPSTPSPHPNEFWCWQLLTLYLTLFSPLPVAVLKRQWDILGWSQSLGRRRSLPTTCLWCGTSSAVTLRQFGNRRVKTYLKKGKVLTGSWIPPLGVQETAFSNLTKWTHFTRVGVVFQAEWTWGRIIASGILGKFGGGLLSTQADTLTWSDKLHFLNPFQLLASKWKGSCANLQQIASLCIFMLAQAKWGSRAVADSTNNSECFSH